MGYASGGTAGPNGVGGAPITLLVDDSRLFCEALLAALGAALNIDRVETAATLGAALERLRRRPAPDLLLFDLKPGDAAGLGKLIELAKAEPGLAVIFVPTPCEDRVVGSVLRVGSGVVPRFSPHGLIVEAIAGAWAGDRHGGSGDLPPPKRQAAPDKSDAAEALKALTAQQARILELVCEGKFNKQIAYELDICEGTVKAHLSAILRKLNVRNRTQAVLLAQSAGFVLGAA